MALHELPYLPESLNAEFFEPYKPDEGPPVPKVLPGWPEVIKAKAAEFDQWCKEHEPGGTVLGTVFGALALIPIFIALKK